MLNKVSYMNLDQEGKLQRQLRLELRKKIAFKMINS